MIGPSHILLFFAGILFAVEALETKVTYEFKFVLSPIFCAVAIWCAYVEWK